MKFIKECAYCGEPIETDDVYYKVLVYTKSGVPVSSPICSNRCVNIFKKLYIDIHQSMLDEMIGQDIQKIIN